MVLQNFKKSQPKINLVNGIEYKSQTEHFFANNFHHAGTTGTEIKMYAYRAIPQYREQIRLKNKMFIKIIIIQYEFVFIIVALGIQFTIGI